MPGSFSQRELESRGTGRKGQKKNKLTRIFAKFPPTPRETEGGGKERPLAEGSSRAVKTKAEKMRKQSGNRNLEDQK